MTVRDRVERIISKVSEDVISDAKYLLLDDQTYFSLKEEVFGSVEAAISEELELFEGLRIFHNNIGETFIDVA